MIFAVTMRPINLAKKAHRICPEYLVEVEATDKAEALTAARISAERDNMRGYAITKITEVTQQPNPHSARVAPRKEES